MQSLFPIDVTTQTRNFDVPASDAVSSIPEFARQAGLQIIAPADQLQGVRTPPIQGEFEIRAALRRLIAGTGLEVAHEDGRIVVLRRGRGHEQR